MHLWIRRSVALSYIVLLFYVFTTPQPKIPITFPHLDKVLHATAYSFLAIVLLWTSRKRSWKRTLIIAIAVSIGYGIFLEWLQGYIPGRDSTAGDMIANCVGALIGCMAYQRWKKGFASIS